MLWSLTLAFGALSSVVQRSGVRLDACRRAAGEVPSRSSPILAALQVVTDIDDTVKSSGGLAIGDIPLGGVDTSYTRDTFYPGVFAFGAELAAHSAGSGEQPARMAVLTARAEEFKYFLEIKQSSKLCVGFRKAGEALGLSDWGVGPVLYGSVLEWVCQERKGWRKFENFKLLRELNGADTTYVLVGDNGKSEKDEEAAQRIVAACPGAVQAVFIHAVSGTQQPAPLPQDTAIRGVPMRYFRTYASAAAKAHRLGLVSAEGARRVLDAVEREMREDRANVRPGGRNEALLLDELREARESLGLLSGPRSALGGAFWSLRRVQGGLFKKKRTDYFQLEER